MTFVARHMVVTRRLVLNLKKGRSDDRYRWGDMRRGLAEERRAGWRLTGASPVAKRSGRAEALLRAPANRPVNDSIPLARRQLGGVDQALIAVECSDGCHVVISEHDAGGSQVVADVRRLGG